MKGEGERGREERGREERGREERGREERVYVRLTLTQINEYLW